MTAEGKRTRGERGIRLIGGCGCEYCECAVVWPSHNERAAVNKNLLARVPQLHLCGCAQGRLQLSTREGVTTQAKCWAAEGEKEGAQEWLPERAAQWNPQHE